MSGEEGDIDPLFRPAASLWFQPSASVRLAILFRRPSCSSITVVVTDGASFPSRSQVNIVESVPIDQGQHRARNEFPASLASRCNTFGRNIFSPANFFRRFTIVSSAISPVSLAPSPADFYKLQARHSFLSEVAFGHSPQRLRPGQSRTHNIYRALHAFVRVLAVSTPAPPSASWPYSPWSYLAMSARMQRDNPILPATLLS